MNSSTDMKEYPYTGIVLNGFLAAAFQLIVLALAAWMFLSHDPIFSVLAIVIAAVTVWTMKGFFMLTPNSACAMTFFGKYRGTYTATGFHWINPLMKKMFLSLRIRNSDINPIKVNDRTGNPVMIGMVLVWQLRDTYKVLFDIDGAQSLNSFVNIQSDAALREVASHYAYDESGHDEVTLRSGGHEVNRVLEQKLEERLSMAGINVVEARINYLAYAPEIAAVMLRRQQATAIIAAREKIVEGAVSMVKMALDRIEEDGVVTLDNDHRARMVGNLLLVLCADDTAQPVIPTNQ